MAADVAALSAVETRLEVQGTARSAVHGQLLRTVLELAALYESRGLGIATGSHAALVLGCSEHRAAALLGDAQALVVLPGALEAVECGLLDVEQSAVLVRQLSVLPLPARLAVWRRLQQRLIAAADSGSVLAPARLSELLRRWVISADPALAVQRRRRAEADRTVDYRLREDGLGDLFCTGFRGPDLRTILSRIAARSLAWGERDDRTADQRRFDAVRDLLLGRDTLPPEADRPAGHCAAGCGGAGCGCRSGQPVPCGAQLVVHVPLGAALGSTDELAVLAGHGPLEPDLLRELLLTAPRLRPVWVGPDGTPVAVGSRVVRPRRDDPQAVRQALLDLAALTPPAPAPRHPHDHQPPAASDDIAQPPGTHPPGTLGPYRPPRWLRRLIDIRSPRCEWPGCGARAVRCDAEHDKAWPDGPTCACNLGPCCRRHHRVKQQGWTKTAHRGRRALDRPHRPQPAQPHPARAAPVPGHRPAAATDPRPVGRAQPW